MEIGIRWRKMKRNRVEMGENGGEPRATRNPRSPQPHLVSLVATKTTGLGASAGFSFCRLLAGGGPARSPAGRGRPLAENETLDAPTCGDGRQAPPTGSASSANRKPSRCVHHLKSHSPIGRALCPSLSSPSLILPIPAPIGPTARPSARGPYPYPGGAVALGPPLVAPFAHEPRQPPALAQLVPVDGGLRAPRRLRLQGGLCRWGGMRGEKCWCCAPQWGEPAPPPINITPQPALGVPQKLPGTPQTAPRTGGDPVPPQRPPKVFGCLHAPPGCPQLPPWCPQMDLGTTQYPKNPPIILQMDGGPFYDSSPPQRCPQTTPRCP